jgi:hypothetical protein
MLNPLQISIKRLLYPEIFKIINSKHKIHLNIITTQFFWNNHKLVEKKGSEVQSNYFSSKLFRVSY